MKKKQRLFGMALLIMGVMLIFSMMGCELFFPEPDPDPDDKNEDVNISSINGLKTYLQSQPQNTADKPYYVNLNVSDLGANADPDGGVSLTGQAIIAAGRYVSLDLSGSTFTSIGEAAFLGCTSLTSVTIPASVDSIGGGAFAQSGITAITVAADNPNYSSAGGILYNKNKTTLVAVGGGVTSVTIPASVTAIGDAAFAMSGITDINIPSGVTSIGASAFLYCENLASVTIPNGVISIGDNAFSLCASLTSITIPDSVTSIGEGAFIMSGIKNVTIGNGIASIKGVFSLCPYLETLTIGSNVSEIDAIDFLFNPNLVAVTVSASNTNYVSVDGILYNKDKTEFVIVPKKITSVSIPSTITKIGISDFSGSGITSINIGNGIEEIENGSFDNCASLTAITVDSGNPNYASEDGILYNKSKTTLIRVPGGITSVTIPAAVTDIDVRAFFRCTKLTGITIPSTVTSIGGEAFWGCTGLTSITIPDSITIIMMSTFYGCTSLANVTIGSGVTEIQIIAFGGCTSLTEITIPENVTKIGYMCFTECTNLVSVTFEGTMTAENTHEQLIMLTEGIMYSNSFLGDLRAKFYGTTGPDNPADKTEGTPGTYTTTAPVDENSVWTLEE
jgi:hypothetical protein